MLVHLGWIAHPARSVASDLRLEIAFGEPDAGPRRSRTFGLCELRDAASFAAWANRRGWNVYVGATLKAADAPLKRRCGSEKATLATCIPVDVDASFIAAAMKLAMISKPQLIVLTGRAPEARGQLFVRIAPTADLSAWEEAHKRVILACGGDENATGRARLMRLAGSVSFPSAAKAQRGYVIERTSAHLVPASEHSVADLLAVLPALPALPPAVMSGASQTSPRRLRPRPPLSAVEAALRALPDAYADKEHLWFRVGLALHDFDAGALGRSLWESFSQRCPEKAALTDFDTRWERFDRPFDGNRLTISWLQREALNASFGG